MGKRKSKSHGKAAGNARSSSKDGNLNENPFEVRISKRRYDILGRKTKHDKGKPGVSRSKGLKKREKTLLVEYKHRNKANSFIDKRFGEYDENLSLEEKMLKRFATEKQKHHEKAGLFNLEDEELTHFGQSLGDIKQFNDPMLDDEESDQEDHVNNNNFGGFLKRKGPNQEKNDNEPRSKKEIMEEVVANAKLKKHERQVLKEESETLRQQLDDDLENVRGLLSFRADGASHPPKGDDYDKSVREMAFEIKAQASDKMKTEEEIAKQEEEILKKLEAERLRRMKGLAVEEKKPAHRSADDLDDGFVLDMDRRSMLVYKDGKMVIPDGYDSDQDLEKDDESAGMKGNEIDKEAEQEDDSDEGEEEEEAEDNSDSSEEECDSDLKSSDNDDSDDDSKQEGISPVNKSKNTNHKTSKHSKVAKDNLPYLFNAPQSFEEFYKLVENRCTKDQLTIIERIQKCNHPKLNPANKAKMECFFDILIQFVGELTSRDPPELSIIDGLVSHLFNLTQHSPLYAAKSMQETLKRLQKQFSAMSKKRKIPSLEMVIYLRIISLLFPTSDFRHGVCTPTLIFMAQILSQITVNTVQNVLRGLFVCNLVYEFVHISKRYVPEVINYFTGILYLSSEKTEPGQVFLPFKANSKYKDILKISSTSTSSNADFKTTSIAKVFSSSVEQDSDATKVHAMRTCLLLLQKFISLYTGLVSFSEIFDPLVHHMKRIQISNYPQEVQSLITDTLKSITSHTSERQPLALQKQRPKPIQTFEPKFEERYEVKRKHSSGNKIINEKQKLRYKHKKEFKGALREIRKDSQFLARQQLQEQLERDAERSRKTKEIQTLLSNQQAEANELNRKKRKLRS